MYIYYFFTKYRYFAERLSCKVLGFVASYNIGQNIRRLFHFLAQFLFTTSETELDYFQQRVNVLVAARDADLRI